MEQAVSLQMTHVDFDEVPEGVSAIGVMGAEGDTKHLWNPKKPAEVEEARKLYGILTEKKYRAFRLRKDGRKKGKMTDFDLMTEFDPDARGILFVPAFAGG